jgi:hypothetical protein
MLPQDILEIPRTSYIYLIYYLVTQYHEKSINPSPSRWDDEIKTSKCKVSREGNKRIDLKTIITFKVI